MTFFPIRRYDIFGDSFERLFDDQLDLFDPWRDFNAISTIVPRNFRWINEPLCLARKRLSSVLKDKYRIQLNVEGFSPETIKTHVEGKKLIVKAKYEDRQPNGDFRLQEMQKSYDLPENAGK